LFSQGIVDEIPLSGSYAKNKLGMREMLVFFLPVAPT
jgi:hypothetical protein